MWFTLKPVTKKKKYVEVNKTLDDLMRKLRSCRSEKKKKHTVAR